MYTVFTEALNNFIAMLQITDSEDLTKAIKEKLPVKVSFASDSDEIKLLEVIQ